MHRCLLVNEILAQIIHLLIHTPQDERSIHRPWVNRQDIARLARTCHLFKEPALDILWNRLGSLGPLFLCLSEDAYEIGRGGLVYPLRKLSLFEVARMKSYSRRIRHLVKDTSNPSKMFPSLHPRALDTLMAAESPQVLFPSLFSIEISLLPAPSPSEIIYKLLSPKLTTLRLHTLHETGDSVRQLLDTVLKEAPYLENLSIVGLKRVNLGELPLCSLRYIQRLDISRSVEITNQSIYSLASLPYLVELRLALQQEIDYALINQLKIRCEETFPRLRSLKIVATENATQWASLFALFSCTCLEEVYIVYDRQCTASYISSFLDVLLSAYSQPSILRTLIIRHEVKWSVSLEHPFIFNSATFKSVLQFTHIETFHCLNAGAYNLDDSFIETAAKAWPRLESLSLDSFIGLYNSHVTLNSLTFFSAHCKALRDLHISLDASVVPPGHSHTKHSDSSACPAITITFRESPLVDTLGVAAFLISNFPHLGSLRSHATTETTEKWRSVATIIKAMREKAMIASHQDSFEEQNGHAASHIS
ncbi:hypothetical protein BJ138DRAFT_1012232 [Hygrophoropsis aurantiaca]|uniref:Uncharacterized protein n=1 Tax=Hygrophoropsis aurantiaca TaxID=72124 RepID=A0ACB8A7K3_9AGAM|nr:hypothetical protein BJ138DRAFT_1012232 [Hygrophoropsis aurantiaca]